MTISSTSSVNRSRAVLSTMSSSLSRFAGRPGALALLRDLAPEADEVADVLLQLLLRQPLGHRAHDETARRRLHAVDRLAQPRALLVAADALADADVLERRQVHDVAAGQRDVAGAPGALGADGLLGDLDDDVLALLDDVADGRGLREATRRPRLATARDPRHDRRRGRPVATAALAAHRASRPPARPPRSAAPRRRPRPRPRSPPRSPRSSRSLEPRAPARGAWGRPDR